MVRVSLQPAPGTQGNAVDIDAGASVTANIAALTSRLGLDIEKQFVVALDANQVAVDFKTGSAENVPSAEAAKFYLVQNAQETEKDAVVITRVDEADTIGQELEANVRRENSGDERTYRNCMAVYVHGYASCGEAQMFPDYNQGLRQAYSGGMEAQVPEAYAAAPSDDMPAFQTSLLRKAYQLGLEGKKEGAKTVPTTEDLREAYKRGKEAVYLTIPDQATWAAQNKDTFKLCSVPTDYAEYLGGVEKKLEDQAVYRELLRQLFHLGVDDAWEARADVHVSEKKAIERVPISPSVIEAYDDGYKAHKLHDMHAKDATLSFEDGEKAKVVLVRGPECEATASMHLFDQGLKTESGKVFDGVAPIRPETAVPDTAAEIKEKVKAAYVEKMKRDKELEKIRKDKERADAAKESEVELTFFESVCKPCMMCYDACCPCMTWKDGEPCMCLGTSCGDWACILLLFAIYYSYLGMWYWAFIEIMMCVAEPARPN